MDIIYLILALWGCTMLSSIANSVQVLVDEHTHGESDDDEQEAA